MIKRFYYFIKIFFYKLGLDLNFFSPKNNFHSFLYNLFLTKKVDMIFDVGAHLGEFHIMVRNLGFKGRILSYEPQIDIFESLSKNISIYSNSFSYNYAISNLTSKKKIFIYKNTQTSSLESSLTKKHTDSYFINTITLDNILMDNIKDKTIKSFLKIDVQGHEFELLKNSNLLETYVDFIQIELAIKKLYRDETLFYEILTFLQKKGFEIIFLAPGVSDKLDKLVQFECLLFNYSK